MGRRRGMVALLLAVGACSFDASGPPGASDDGGGDDAPVSTLDGTPPGDAADTSQWAFRKPITIDGDQVAAPLLDFPLLVDLDADPELAASAEDTGVDLLFTDDSNVRLSFELEVFDGDSGRLVAWVRIPALDDANDTVIYLYYGNPEAAGAQDDPTGVWIGGYAGVWHLQQEQAGIGAPGVYLDSTASANHGQDLVDGTDQTGHILAGQAFDGVDDHVRIDDPGRDWEFDDGGLDAGTGSFTISAWVQYDSSAPDFHTIVKNGAGSPTQHGYWLNYRSGEDQLELNLCDGTNRFVADSDAGVPFDDDNGWHHVTASFERGATDTASFFIDGAPFGGEASPLVAGNSVTGTDFFKIGANQGGMQRPWPGNLDEVRVSSVVRPAAWVATEFANQDNPGGFCELGPQEPL